MQTDRHMIDMEFSLGDEVYLKLQPYKQKSLGLRSHLNISPRFFGPFKILQRIEKVAYKLDMPLYSQIYPVLQVSCLKP